MRSRVARGAAIAIMLSATAGCGGDDMTQAQVQGYRPGPGANQVTVVYLSGPDDHSAVAEVVSQEAAAVEVAVRFKRAESTSDSIAVPREVVVTLDDPLGDRRLLDQEGQPVPSAPAITPTNS